MYDASPEAAERALMAMEKRVADLVEFDLVEAADAPGILQRITIAPSLEDALKEMISYPGPFVLDVMVPYQEHVLPMIPSGHTVDDMILK